MKTTSKEQDRHSERSSLSGKPLKLRVITENDIEIFLDHETGVPRAMARTSNKEGEGIFCEMKVAQRLILEGKDLSNKLITADALHCQHVTANAIVEKGGDFLIQVKDNQISSLPPERYTPEQWLNLIRNHWGGCEIRNHWRKDACLLEDKTRSRDPNVVGTFALLRNILLFFFNEQQAHPTIPGFIEDAVTSPSSVYAMLKAI